MGFDDGEDVPLGESYFFPDTDGELDPKPIARRLVAECEEFLHLRVGEAAILFIMRADPEVKAQRQILGYMALPRFQGSLGKVARWLLAKVCDGLPDFIMVLDNTWWVQASPTQREALVFHELLHAAHATDKEGEPRFTDDGKPIWDIRGHDIEEFNEVVRRYGAWSPDVSAFIKALAEGKAI